VALRDDGRPGPGRPNVAADRAHHGAASTGTATITTVRNVASIVRGPRIDHDEVRPWSLDEAATFLAAASAHRLSALFAVGVAVGLRRGELLALAWGRC
jgi:integrase